jgi:hypothetical protein
MRWQEKILRRLLGKPEVEKKEPMSKNDEAPRPDVIWHLAGDAMRPKGAPWGFVAQNPVQRVIPPGQKMRIDTGISANVPMLAFPRGDQADYVDVPIRVPAGHNLVVVVENKSQHTALVVDDAEAIANLCPLIFRGTTEVD